MLMDDNVVNRMSIEGVGGSLVKPHTWFVDLYRLMCDKGLSICHS